SFPKRRPCRDDGLGQAAMFAGGAWTEARPPRVSKIGPALSSSNTIRRRPSADPVQKHAPGNGYGAKKGLTSRGPLQKQTFLGRNECLLRIVVFAEVFPKTRRPLLGTLLSLMSALRFVAIGASMAAYFGLAVLGAGGQAAFFSQPALTGLTLVFAALGATAFLAGGNMSSGEREDRSNRWVIPVFMALGLALAYLPAYTDRVDFWTIDGEVTRWVGVFLFAIGGTLRL